MLCKILIDSLGKTSSAPLSYSIPLAFHANFQRRALKLLLVFVISKFWTKLNKLSFCVWLLILWVDFKILKSRWESLVWPHIFLRVRCTTFYVLGVSMASCICEDHSHDATAFGQGIEEIHKVGLHLWLKILDCLVSLFNFVFPHPFFSLRCSSKGLRLKSVGWKWLQKLHKNQSLRTYLLSVVLSAWKSCLLLHWLKLGLLHYHY